MAQKYYNTDDAAEVLGVSVDQVKAMQQRREIHGYRDGADWKFKAEVIDDLVGKVTEQPPVEIPEDEASDDATLDDATPDDGDDVLLSEVEFGASDPSASGTVIGMESDLSVAGESDIQLAGAGESAAPQSSEVANLDELDLTLEEDLSLIEDEKPVAGAGDSDVDLAGDALEDDDLVLGGSGVGSDITIGSDSGISLVDPADSGLSLEEPLELAGSGIESLELGEDDVIELADGDDASNELKTDDDFLLTPMEDVGEDDGSESSSQVIALDTGSEEIDAGVAGGMAAMLDEDLSSQGNAEMGFGEAMDPGAMGAQAGGFAEGAQLGAGTMTLPEAPYSGWNIAGLAICSLMLIFCGMFTYDLLQNMWSWGGAFDANSAIMDLILEQLPE